MKQIEQGSSLVELLIVLTVLAITSVGSIIGVRELLERPALALQSREVLAVLSAADERALGTGRQIELEVDSDTGTIWELAGNQRTTRLFQLTSGIRIQRVSFGVGGKGGPRSVYYGNGVTSPGTIVLSDRRERICALAQSMRGHRHITCESDSALR